MQIRKRKFAKRKKQNKEEEATELKNECGTIKLGESIDLVLKKVVSNKAL